MKMRTLEERRTRMDMIETFKILTGKSNVNFSVWFSLAKVKETVVSTRAATGHLNLVQPTIPNTDLSRNFFSHRVVPLWNQLPNSVKMAGTTNGFKNLYDSFTGYSKLNCDFNQL